MAEYKCEMCGGTMEVDQYATVATCEFCGAQRVLPQSVVADAENIRRDGVLNTARNKMQSNTIFECQQALRLLQSIAGWKNADELARQCRQKLEQLNAVAEKERVEKAKKNKKAAKKLLRILIIALIAGVLLLVLTALVMNFAVPQMKKAEMYKDALEDMEDGEYGTAIDQFIELEGYKDSAEKILECEMEILEGCEIGDTIYLGQYTYDAGYGEGGIRWLVLDIQDGKALVISKCVLTTGFFHKYNEPVLWEDCTLRIWLNETFMDQAFTEEEQKLIVRSTVENIGHDGAPCDSTEDYVFLLSEEEVLRYFESADRRKCAKTPYVDKYAYEELWMTRDTNQNKVMYITDRGYFDMANVHSDSSVDLGGVRPAMWIEIDP